MPELRGVLRLPPGTERSAVKAAAWCGNALDGLADGELAQVLSLIVTINTWNRVALATRKVAGTDER